MNIAAIRPQATQSFKEQTPLRVSFEEHFARTIFLGGGNEPKNVALCLEYLRQDNFIYQRGGELVYVADGIIHLATPDFLRVHLSSLASFQKPAPITPRNPAGQRRVDCPKDLAQAIIARRGLWELPELRGLLSAPVLLPDGRLIAEGGFDTDTGLLLVLPGDYVCCVPNRPAPEDARRALEMLWRPFLDFPFVGPVDRGVMLAALLTAVVRPVLPTAPGILFDSPTAGSGKTLLTSCISLLAGMPHPEMMPAANNDENELRKRLLAVARSAKPVSTIDNISGQLESAALCAFITSETYSDRLLGQSLNLAFPVVSLVILNGNNARLVGDLNRRVLRCRIDPQMERPDQRSFDLDPAEYVLTHRMEMVEAALTLLRSAEPVTTLSRLASFEVWSDFVRQAVIWAGGLGVVELADPIESIDLGYSIDPETQKLGALLEAWWSAFGDRRMKVAEVIHAAESGQWPGLYDAIHEIAGERNAINSRRLGRWIEGHSGRIIDGLRVERVATMHGLVVWQVRGRDPSNRPCAAGGF